MMKWIAGILTAAVVFTAPALANPSSDGAISIPLKEYERLKNLEEGDQKKQYWKMTFEQILQKENNRYASAWELYEFWVMRRIYLKGAVTSASTSKIIDQIEVLNKTGATPITLVIQSPGGDVLSGLSLVNVMKRSVAPVNTVCDNFAVSMGAVLFAVGKHRVADEGCIFMIHDVAVGAPGGQTMEHVKWTETVIEIENILIDILADSSGLSTKDVRTLMEYETFWDAEDTYRLGFADEFFFFSKNKEEHKIPEDLLPINRMKTNFNEKLSK